MENAANDVRLNLFDFSISAFSVFASNIRRIHLGLFVLEQTTDLCFGKVFQNLDRLSLL